MNSVFHIGLLTMLGICAVMDCMYRRVWMPLTGIMLCYTVIAGLLTKGVLWQGLSFGRRISMLQYMKFSTLLVQNLKKGSDDLLRRMELEAEDAVRIRRELAKKQGEEAGTKLLLPMMLMLVVVFAMILTAAFRAM